MTTSLYYDEPKPPTMQAEELVSKIKLLYATGIVGFIHHVESTACKVTEKQRNRKIGMLDEQVQERYQDIVLSTIFDDKLTMVMELDDNCVACGQEDNISNGSKGGSKNRNKDPDWEAFLKTYKR